MPGRPLVLILSFSPIGSDARVLKQLELAREVADVVTCGYGDAPAGVVEHVRIPDDRKILPLRPKLLVLRLRTLALHRAPAIAWVRSALAGRRFDAVIVNELEAAPVGLSIPSAGGHLLDLHEYTPRLHDDSAGWRRYLQPLFESTARRWLPRASAVTTVGARIAQEYARLSGVTPDLVVNAAPFADRRPTEVGEPIRLVHSGACLRRRGLLELVEAVESTSTPVTLDLYLMPNDPGLLGELRELAAASDRVTVHDPVPYARLVDTLNGYDIGVHVLPPVTVNNEWALPNKFFDYVQARLGVIVGPSPEMARYAVEHGLGLVTAGFSAADLASTLDSLTLEQVRSLKEAAHRAAAPLSSEHAMGAWRDALRTMLERARS
ncbi:hypothetical protein [Yonghaparkia sp. Root332]|uniref:hypothetical protein n=1 Tax=Yonghaparkia sp. Root332 TaxID=1736516 RepID=UPI0006FA9072|nr:hypothetical protein [Yonghaparkia sp. Root332]KQV25471.1 hypothetical protein ASC54_00205 [Yonghaparkia sp. Root332]